VQPVAVAVSAPPAVAVFANAAEGAKEDGPHARLRALLARQRSSRERASWRPAVFRRPGDAARRLEGGGKSAVRRLEDGGKERGEKGVGGPGRLPLLLFCQLAEAIRCTAATRYADAAAAAPAEGEGV
jgi:hypothetical protein